MGTIVKRGDSWRAVIRKKGHPTMTKTFSKQALAKKWVMETELALERREVVSSDALVGDLIQKYIEDVMPSREVSRHTKARYRQLRRWTARIRVGDLTADVLLKWKEEHCPKASPASFAQYLTTIWSILKDAEAFWNVVIPYADMRKARTVLKRVGAINNGNIRNRRPQPEEIEAIKANLGQTQMPMADIIDFAMLTGMRVSEITRIRWDDLDEERAMVVIHDRKHPTRKLGNNCNVPLLFGSIDIVKRQPRDSDRIFPFKPETVTNCWLKARFLAGVEDLKFHDLRHEAISRMFEKGFSIPEVVLVSGHRSWENLKRYTNLKPESLHDK